MDVMVGNACFEISSAICQGQCFVMFSLLFVFTSQNMVSRSSGRRPLESSIRKSLRMNFLKPQSLPWTNLYARWLSTSNIHTHTH